MIRELCRLQSSLFEEDQGLSREQSMDAGKMRVFVEDKKNATCSISSQCQCRFRFPVTSVRTHGQKFSCVLVAFLSLQIKNCIGTKSIPVHEPPPHQDQRCKQKKSLELQRAFCSCNRCKVGVSERLNSYPTFIKKAFVLRSKIFCCCVIE